MQCLLHLYFSSTILLIKVPTPWETNTLNSSPSLRVIRGVDVHPTPAGVLPQTRERKDNGIIIDKNCRTYPVIMMVPAGRVVPWERKERILGTEKIKSLHIQVSSIKYNHEQSTHSSWLDWTVLPLREPSILTSERFLA